MSGRRLFLGGQYLSFVAVVNKEIARIAPISRKSKLVPGRPGAVPNGYEVGPRPIKVIVEIEAATKEGWLTRFDELAGFVITEEPVELEFESEPGRFYMAEFEGEMQTREMNIYGQIELNFICNDPYAYKAEKSFQFVNGAAAITIGGTVESKPIYEIDVLEDITHLDVFTDEHYLRIGKPAPIEEVVYQRTTLLLSDNLTSLANWSTAQEVDNGYIAGTMTATAGGLTATNFGTAITPKKWQGPSVRRSLPEVVQNFQIDVPVEMMNVSKETGMIEVYLRDALGNTVAKIGIEDIWISLKRNQTKFQLGNVATRTVQHYRHADNPSAWNNFKGLLRIWRDGNRFRPYFALVDSAGRHSWVSSKWMYTDFADDYSAPIASIQLAIRKYPGSAGSEADMKIKGVKLWRLNDPAAGIPIMANAGAKIIIDTAKGVVLLNGEEREDLKDWFSDFFAIEPGTTTLLLQPFDKVSGKVKLRERLR